MFFGLPKFLVHLARPGDLLLLLLVLGVVLMHWGRHRKAGARLVTGVALAALAIWLLPVAAWLGRPLEARFPRPEHLPAQVDGVIVLGGAVDALTTARRGLPTLNADAERMTEFVRLARLYPNAKLAFSGGGAVFRKYPAATEAGVARLFFRQQGLDERRIVFENRSLDTFQNVLFLKPMAKPRAGETWLLVTTAMDAPRCVGVFRRQDWPVIPVPVAYKTVRPGTVDFASNLSLLNRVTHEWLGLLAYRMAGRTATLFPGPRQP